MADNGKRKEYEEYFSDIISELEEEFKKSNEYSKKIDSEISKFDGALPQKGTQYFLIEHLKNAIALQSQRQSIIKDKFSIKKSVLDYVMKDKTDDEKGKTLFEELSKIVKNDKEQLAKIGQAIDSTIQKQNQEELDSKIDEILDNSEEE